jgi:hypothetical protein
MVGGSFLLFHYGMVLVLRDTCAPLLALFKLLSHRRNWNSTPQKLYDSPSLHVGQRYSEHPTWKRHWLPSYSRLLLNHITVEVPMLLGEVLQYSHMETMLRLPRLVSREHYSRLSMLTLWSFRNIS